MVHVQKNKLLLASIVAVSFFGKQAQAVKGGALVNSTYQSSVSNCAVAGALFPKFLAASVVVDTVWTLREMRKQKALRTGTGCPLGGYGSETIPGTVKQQAVLTEKDHQGVVRQYNSLVSRMKDGSTINIQALQPLATMSTEDESQQSPLQSQQTKAVVTSNLTRKFLRVGRFELHADIAEKNAKSNIVAQLWGAKWGVDLPSAKHTAATVGTLVLWTQAQKYMAGK